MYITIWRFHVTAEHATDFERHYGAEGTWAALFRKSSEYIGTELFKGNDAPGTYLTVDTWTSREAYEAFRREEEQAYRTLDEQMDRLTASEEHVGDLER